MTLSPEYVELIIETLVKKLSEDDDINIRIKAVESLGKLGSEGAISPLCEALNVEDNPDVTIAIMDAINAIVVINNATFITKSEQPTNQYNFYDTVNTSAINVEKDQYNK